MFGYTVFHEAAINRQAAAIKALAAEYKKAISEAEEVSRMPGWDSPAADTQREEIKRLLQEARSTARELQQIGDDLYAFTEEHKTWLEEIIDAIT